MKYPSYCALVKSGRWTMKEEENGEKKERRRKRQDGALERTHGGEAGEKSDTVVAVLGRRYIRVTNRPFNHE